MSSDSLGFRFEQVTPPSGDYAYVREICQWFSDDETISADDMASVSLMASYLLDELANFVLWSRSHSSSHSEDELDEVIEELRNDDGFVEVFLESFPMELPEFYYFGFRSGIWPSQEDDEFDL